MDEPILDAVIPSQESPAPPAQPALEGLLTSLLAEFKGLREDVFSLKKDQSDLREQVEQASFAAPGTSHTSDPSTPAPGGAQFARRVTLATRPVVDAPENYKGIISTAELRLPS